jgi:DNA-directed RNA polymerase II subunit RPB2
MTFTMESDPIDPKAYIEEPWDVIGSYFKGQHLSRLVTHQLESFNSMVKYKIPNTISMFNPVKIVSTKDVHAMSGKNRLEMSVEFENFGLLPPQLHENNGASKLMFPQEARLRNFTYASNMQIDLKIKYLVRTGEDYESEQIFYRSLKNIHIGKLPIMLKSCICSTHQYKHLSPEMTGECSMDAGGYFIINGSEKTCLAQERVAENMVHVFNIEKSNTKWSWSAEVKSVPDFKSISPKQINMYISTKNNGFGYGLFIQLPKLVAPIPLFVLFRALGIDTDKEICRYIILDTDEKKENVKLLLKLLQGSVVDANTYPDKETAFDYIVSQTRYVPLNIDKEIGVIQKRRFTLNILENEMFPHVKKMGDRIYFLGYMTMRLLRCSIGWDQQTDRDSYLNKRIDLPGVLINNLFRNYFNKLVKDMEKAVSREINNGSWRSTDDYGNIINRTNVYKIIKYSTLDNGIRRALSTGDFAIKHSSTNRVGVAQVLNRLTYIATLSHLRRVNTPMDKGVKLVPPRKLHNSTWGFMCPAETPEGHSCGLVKNLSWLTHITQQTNSTPIYTYIDYYIDDIDSVPKNELSELVKVFINGAWIGITKTPMELYNDLKYKKEMGSINVYTSIIFDYRMKEIKICTDAGRLVRPLLRVKSNQLVLDKSHISKLRSGELVWEDLITNSRLKNAVIEYIDPCEQNASMISVEPIDITSLKNGMRYNYTHCEIHPSSIFGILASCIPFPEHNQSPRNTYQCAMGKQAMGIYVTNYDTRMDKTAYVLNYAMRPLVDTRVMNLLQLNKTPSGCQVVVAIMTHSGYNQEDSILFNKGSIDRGLFQTTVYHTEKDEDKKVHGDEELRCKPDKTRTRGMKMGNYDKINEDGVIPENTLVENRDVIISKVLPIRDARNDHTKSVKYDDHSRVYRTTEETYIDKNYIDRNGDGYSFCKVRLRCVRKPVIGDKFSSRHGQKGTIGNIIPECDMPYTKSGLKPDIIINPHAIPSRMTIAQLKETLLGKVILELGLFGDGTSFGKFEINDIRKELQRVGYESNGEEIMYNGLTGEQIETSIFIGPVFYQRLKHMVVDKVHARSFGPTVSLTRQPAEGRARSGGLRYGEMERDCMCSHGASTFNKERLYDVSDAYSVHVCKSCGIIAAYNNEKHIHLCKTCGNTTNFAYVKIPYSCKLLFQELATMSILPRILTD